MKLGFLGNIPNKMYKAGEPCDLGMVVSTVWQNQIRKFYPDEKFVTMNLEEPDMNLAKQVDLLFIRSDTANHSTLIKYIHALKCRTIVHIPDGYYSLYRSVWGICLQRQAILDACDFVISMDHENIEVLRMFTKSKVFWWPLPYPVSDIYEAIKGEPVEPMYDIVIPYGPAQSVNKDRNGYFTALLASKMVREIDGLDNIGIFSWSPKPSPPMGRVISFLTKLGGRDFTMLPLLGYPEAMKILAGAKLFLYMDSSRAAGRWAIESAVLQVPTIFSDTIPQARYIYGAFGRVAPFDAEEAMALAHQFVCGECNSEALIIAAERASDFSIENAKVILEQEVR